MTPTDRMQCMTKVHTVFIHVLYERVWVAVTAPFFQMVSASDEGSNFKSEEIFNILKCWDVMLMVDSKYVFDVAI